MTSMDDLAREEEKASGQSRKEKKTEASPTERGKCTDWKPCLNCL